MRESNKGFVEKGPLGEKRMNVDEAQRAANVVLDQARARLARAEQVKGVSSKDARGLDRARRAYTGTLRAIAFLAGTGVMAGTVYKGMEEVADYLGQKVTDVVRASVEPLKAFRSSDESVEDPSSGSADADDAAIEPQTVGDGDPSSIIIELPPIPATEPPDATVAPPDPFEVDREGGTAIGEGLASVLWADPAFQRLSSVQEMEAFINQKVEELCPDTGRAGDGCNPFSVKQAVQTHLLERMEAGLRGGASDSAHLFQMGQALEKLTPGGMWDHRMPFTSLDVAVRAGRPDLVHAYIGADIYSDAAGPGRFASMLTPERAEAVLENYRGLNAEDRAFLDRAFRARVNELSRERDTNERATFERMARRAHIDLTVDDFPEEDAAE